MIISMITISVIIPTFNCKNYLQRAINSVLSQSFPPTEMIIIDDGSTDNTKNFIQENYPQIKYIYQENLGPSIARNTGIKYAKSDWICFLDADDEWLPNNLKDKVSIIQNHPNIVWCAAPYILHYAKEKQKYINFSRAKKKIQFLNVFNDVKNFRERVKAELISTCGVMIKKNVLFEVGGFDESLKYGEDIDLWFRIALKYPQIGYTEKSSFIYDRNNSNSLTKTRINYQDLNEEIRRINKSWTHTLNVPSEIKIVAANILNIWVYRQIKRIIKFKKFEMINTFDTEMVNYFNIRNKILHLVISKLFNIIRKIF